MSVWLHKLELLTDNI